MSYNNNLSQPSHFTYTKMSTEASVPQGDMKSVTKRLRQELMNLMKTAIPGVSAFPSGEDILSWVATIKGTADTPYEGMAFKLSLRFTTSYPYVAPVVKFETSCFHPNVDQYGNICLDILKVCPSLSPDRGRSCILIPLFSQ